jgi:3'-phosphoadenosine 5'-phosphosulfate sulfotransferase (PAPS reductase)/FAD synthetase
VLVGESRCRPGDLERWAELERGDAVWASTRAFARRVERARRAALSFAAKGGCYSGVSWGKDSVALTHLLVGTRTPIVWVRVEPLSNPDCLVVRDAFLREHDVNYHEIEVVAERDERGLWAGTGRLEQGFAEAAQRFGARYLSGVRGQESIARRNRMKIHGIESKNTSVPLGYWKLEDVYAYLYAHRLPVHPAYACTLGGLYSRDHLRVATLGGERGTEHGRRAWEFAYYPEDMHRIFAGYQHVGGL